MKVTVALAGPALTTLLTVAEVLVARGLWLRDLIEEEKRSPSARSATRCATGVAPLKNVVQALVTAAWIADGVVVGAVVQGFAGVDFWPAWQSGTLSSLEGTCLGVCVAGAKVEIVVDPIVVVLVDDPPPPQPATAQTSAVTAKSSPMRRRDLTTRR